MTQRLINQKVESLVGQRLTKEEINVKLAQFFGGSPSVSEYEREECVKRDLPHLDNQLVASIENDEADLYIDIDLYYLLDNGGKHYITEVCFNYH